MATITPDRAGRSEVGRLVTIHTDSRHCLRRRLRCAAAESESGALGTFIALQTAHMLPALKSRYYATTKSHGFGRGLVHHAQMVLHATRYQLPVSQYGPPIKMRMPKSIRKILWLRLEPPAAFPASLDRRWGSYQTLGNSPNWRERLRRKNPPWQQYRRRPYSRNCIFR
jgi:hypothetical protein